MIEDVKFDDTDGYIRVQIDDAQSDIIPIKRIKRMATTIDIIGSIDTPLYTPINIDLLISILSEDEEKSVIESGFVNISITDIDNHITYDSQKVIFKNGVIQTQMIDTLPLGTYLLHIKYAGNKYYLPTDLDVYFTIQKREIECKIHDNILGGYPNEEINIGVSLSDSINKRTIDNCIINYTFNDTQYITQTNNVGFANLQFLMPGIDSLSCAMNILTNDQTIAEEYETNPEIDVYWVDDGNIISVYDSLSTQEGLTQFINNDQEQENEEEEEEQYSYVTEQSEEESEEENEEETITEEELIKQTVYIYDLTLNVQNDYYQMEDYHIYLSIYKYDTNITCYTEQNDNEKILNINGDIIAYNDTYTNNAQYGTVKMYISDIDYTQYFSIDNNGHFDASIPYSNFNQSVSNNVLPQEPQNYAINHATQINITDPNNQTFYRDYINKHHITFTAQIQDTFLMTPVLAGMVSFVITKDNKEVYRYVTEVNDKKGDAHIVFDISTLGQYEIQAFYHPIFNYLASQSSKIKYTITEE